MKTNGAERIVLTENGSSAGPQLELFALLNLGLVQSLVSGALSVTEALEQFYHADNCLFVKKHLRNRTADAIMSHGVQLPDLFDVLPAEEAQREFYHELETMRSLCLQLLTKQRGAVMKQQAAQMVAHYTQTTKDRNDWQTGDFLGN